MKDYVFTRMGKPILLELALTILQDLISNGKGRGETLQLKIEKTVRGGKIVVHPEAETFKSDKQSGETPETDVEAAHFTISDTSGSSPDVKFKSGKGFKPPYLPPDKDVYFTPRKGPRKSLIAAFEVCQLRCLTGSTTFPITITAQILSLIYLLLNIALMQGPENPAAQPKDQLP